MGKERLAKVFAQKNKDILSIYLSAGYPKLDAMPKLADVLAKNKVDFIEAGMPYSDPLADGPTIQKSSSIALKNGMNLDLYFDQIKQIRQQSDIPIIFMGYFNQVLKTGVDIFLQKCVESGIDGLIIPDLTPEIYQASYQAMFEKSD
ncbi:MAG TPA: tryptophan synthase subunit alpha, partial [Flavobacteriales bacterium]|nr:tryptophan synthase subunit alpha [Flavobacteriales bacterium]